MSRKRLTEIFPGLLPIRQKQRKFFFYLKMKLDKEKYCTAQSDSLLKEILFEDRTVLINEKSGMDIQYQYNKVHNLKLASATIDGIIIQPNETFSFWQCVCHAEALGSYKDGLSLINGELVSIHGGGLCQISNLLFWCFLHTSLTITERHTHFIKAFPDPPGRIPEGVDATVSEGWKDLKVKNNTNHPIQIILKVEEDHLYAALRADKRINETVRIESRNQELIKMNDQLFEKIEIWKITDKEEKRLYVNQCRIGYDIQERGNEK